MTGARTSPEFLKAQEPTRRKANARKDRKRWCGGKEGREHDYHVIVPHNYPDYRDRNEPCRESKYFSTMWFCKHSNVCTKCGRQEYVDREQCPDWKAENE